MENWKSVKGYEGFYEVSDLGNVRSVDRVVNYKNGKKRFWKGQLLKEMTQKTGYKTVNLNKNGKMKYFFVHRLVAENFLNHKSSIAFPIDHIDNDKENNKLSNLQVLTHRQNINKKNRGKSKYLGVTVASENRTKRFYASITHQGKLKGIGYFKTELEASEAYQKELKKLNICLLR